MAASSLQLRNEVSSPSSSVLPHVVRLISLLLHRCVLHPRMPPLHPGRLRRGGPPLHLYDDSISFKAIE